MHVLDALHLDPARFRRVCPPFADFAGRIYGYIQKAKVDPAQVRAWRQKIARYVK